MKTLESRYIDLANFYKKELINKSDSGMRASDISSQSKSAVGGVVQHPPFRDQTNQGFQQLPAPAQNANDTSSPSEDTIINDLKNEKIKFEQNIKSIMESGGLGIGASDDTLEIENEQLIRFNNEL